MDLDVASKAQHGHHQVLLQYREWKMHLAHMAFDKIRGKFSLQLDDTWTVMTNVQYVGNPIGPVRARIAQKPQNPLIAEVRACLLLRPTPQSRAVQLSSVCHQRRHDV